VRHDRGVVDVEPVGPAPALRGPVMMSQAWRDVAFLHWAVPPERVAPLLPAGVVPDVLDGATYVGLVPFRMVGAGLGHGPGVPWAGTFLETNVRLYTVDATGRRGIAFRTLECSRLLSVAGARASFGLPYRWARMAFAERTGPGGARELAYRTRGRGARSGVASRVVLRVEPGRAPAAEADLVAFLTSRWGLHEGHLGRTWYVPNQHEAWPMQGARVLALEDGLVAAAGFPELTGRAPDHVAFSSGVTTRFGLPEDGRRPRR
jgi:uncharacterized protein YqjF (DUF2071 family)